MQKGLSPAEGTSFAGGRCFVLALLLMMMVVLRGDEDQDWTFLKLSSGTLLSN